MSEARNPISGCPAVDALCDLIEQTDRDLDCRVVILTGAGTAFSTGGDINSMRPGHGLGEAQPARTRQNYRQGIQRLPLLFEIIEVPVIAAVNGAAVGAGCDLACMCDVRIASEQAKFAESFVKLVLVLVPGDGGAWLLPRVVGWSKASEMALTGDLLDATQALACGLVSKVVPADKLIEESRALAQRIAASPSHAVRMTKQLIRESRLSSLSVILEASAAAQSLCHTTADHDEAVNAFLEKRQPVFAGN
ncbi:Enoyl-CoA hydratase [Sphingobium herbicidovorans NBRC 16415]|uniref:Enoyl-CoA hydratase n=1 Tax=Sphingobium herbicidovorans (strain ATCC 700291 / DSM 11019 / CCUG 56400 / KCTC 2939 / LMG 18315 / NBRC 16415 / MH) TaxID=1219045 RepID=A0A086PBZ3_SPHHM|nr:crotonase/enoyl-CoA hydratase family protein [Sphingobium herbicidovorans]KFG90911.1 Enoyl-CoA hydratase [Sphingobium herbicidovorans NBRC 16415]